MGSAEDFLSKRLQERHDAGNHRTLKPENSLIDFCSNDYLGFARSAELRKRIDNEIAGIGFLKNGSTGSRLLSGNSRYSEETEQYIADLYNCEAGLIFNSGYDANLGLFSSLPQHGDTIICDELAHASIIDGARLSFAKKYSFRHNDLDSLEKKLKAATGNCYIAIESVYSMDGDTPPLEQIALLAERYNANLIIDEAHAVGLYGLGLVKGDLAARVFARVVTFGKALGGHGAIVLGTKKLIEYLINFARSFIYTTAAPHQQIVSIKMAYQLLLQSEIEIEKLENNIRRFKQKVNNAGLIESDSAIQCIITGSNATARQAANLFQHSGIDVRAILSPTVAQGSERIRVCLHSFNTANEIDLLTNIINNFTDAQ